jgi:dolichol-phosphate mannosyltransferase
VLQRGIERRAFAAIHSMMQHLHLLGSKSVDDCAGAVCRCVVDYDNLEIIAHRRLHPFDDLSDGAALIVAGDDNGKAHERPISELERTIARARSHQLSRACWYGSRFLWCVLHLHAQPNGTETYFDELPHALPGLTLLSVIIPARNEEHYIASTVEHLCLELRLHNVPHEIMVVDDASSDRTWSILTALQQTIPELSITKNTSPHGFGRAVICGLDRMKGDAAVIMMADQSDDCRDVVRYWKLLNEGYECVFGSRFMRGSGVIDYPRLKLVVNRCANLFVRTLFGFKLNDTTNAFKAYRRTVIEGCRPLISPHFNITVELPLKAITRGYSWISIPITWHNRRSGESKLRMKEMGSRYLFICLYILLEKWLSLADYRKNVSFTS